MDNEGEHISVVNVVNLGEAMSKDKMQIIAFISCTYSYIYDH